MHTDIAVTIEPRDDLIPNHHGLTKLECTYYPHPLESNQAKTASFSLVIEVKLTILDG